jgi:hypothetical protein
MILIPILSCGFLAFVPSIWVGVVRRADRPAMVRSFVVAAAFFLIAVAAFVGVGTAPKDENGTSTGAASDVTIALVLLSAVAAAVLAFVQRNPAKRLERS